MRILVTGATGRVGANLVKRLMSEGHDVRAHVFPGDGARAAKLDGIGAKTIEGDLRDFEALCEVVSGSEVVYHLAAAMRGPFDNLSFFDTNVLGTELLLEAARQHAPELKRFIYASTDAIYPAWPGRDTTEEYGDARPKGTYAFTKWMGEQAVHHYGEQHNLPVTVFRFAWVIGPGEVLEKDYFSLFWLSRWMRSYENRSDEEGRRVYEGLKAAWPGEDRLAMCIDFEGRPFQIHTVDLRDLLQGLLLGMTQDAAIGEAFTLGAAEPIVWDTAIPYLSEKLGVPSVEVTVPSTGNRAFDVSKARRMLGYEPEHDVKSMVDLALRMQAGEDIDLIPAGVPYGSAG